MQTNQSHDLFSVSPPAPLPFASARTRGIVAIAFLALSIVQSVASLTILYDYFVVDIPPLKWGGSLLALPVGLACVVSFLFWFHRAYRNLRPLGAEELNHSAASATGWWFVPVAFFWKPVQAMVEIWKASNPDWTRSDRALRKTIGAPVLLVVWWTTYLSALLLDNVLAGPDRAFYEGQGVTKAMIVASAFDILAAVLTMAAILEINRRQTKSHDRRVQPSPEPVTAVTETNGVPAGQ